MENRRPEDTLGLQGTVTMSLVDYNFMRDTLETLFKTTHTQNEFLKKLRVSLSVIIGKMKEEGVDISEVYSYYKDLEFPSIEDIVVERGEDNGEKPGVIKLKIVTKDSTDEE